MTDAPIPQDTAISLAAYRRGGLLLVAFMVTTLLAWGVFAQIAGAVVAAGRVAVESSVKKVQHREGGIVSDLLVRDGQHVTAGQVLVRLDSTISSANAIGVTDEFDQLTARRLRLDAERRGLADIGVSSPAGASANFQAMLAAERRLMATRGAARRQRKAQLQEQITQSMKEIEGVQAQVVSQERQQVLIEGELAGVRSLYDRGFAPVTRLNELSRESERLTGQRGELTASVARNRTRISEIRLQILQVDSEAMAEVMAELKETEIKLTQLTEQKVTADDQMRRVDIRSPVSGYVQQLAVHTKGGVISPGETLMLIVPENDALVVQAKIDPQHIDQVQAGRPAHVRFTSFSSRRTPELSGKVDMVSADAETDQQTGLTYYTARLSLDRGALPAALVGRLVPGMPAEVQIETGSRSALSYLLKPLADQLHRSFREE